MNRFLYALANPATMIDPTGHAACGPDGIWCQQNSVAQHAKKYTPPKKFNVSHKASGCRYGSEDCHVNKRTAAHKQSSVPATASAGGSASAGPPPRSIGAPSTTPARATTGTGRGL